MLSRLRYASSAKQAEAGKQRQARQVAHADQCMLVKDADFLKGNFNDVFIFFELAKAIPPITGVNFANFFRIHIEIIRRLRMVLHIDATFRARGISNAPILLPNNIPRELFIITPPNIFLFPHSIALVILFKKFAFAFRKIFQTFLIF